MVDPQTCLFNMMCYSAKFGYCRSNSASICTRYIQIIGPSGLPFKVIKNVTVQSDTCDFFLVIVMAIVISSRPNWADVIPVSKISSNTGLKPQIFLAHI